MIGSTSSLTGKYLHDILSVHERGAVDGRHPSTNGEGVMLMKKAFVFLLLLYSFSSAAGGRAPGVSENPIPAAEAWSGSPGEGADALFMFLAYDDFVPDSAYACGDSYWNPLFEQSGSGWQLNDVCGSWAEPSGAPYHWNGGMGTAMDALGLTWEWFPGYTGRCGQSIPDAATLAQYQVVFVLTFDAYRSIVLNSSSRSTLETYMGTGGHVVLISQDALFSGVPADWLDEWFDSGDIVQDVHSGTNPFPAYGLPVCFLVGWTGTALIENFSTGAGGYSEGRWWADGLYGSGSIGDASYVFASCNEMYGTFFSTFDFEACYPSEVQSICGLLMEWLQGTSLQRTTWGAIKTAL